MCVVCVWYVGVPVCDVGLRVWCVGVFKQCVCVM